MSHFVAPVSFDRAVYDLTSRTHSAAASSCCERAVAEALENAGSMGSIAIVAMLLVGFAVGLTSAWLLFG